METENELITMPFFHNVRMVHVKDIVFDERFMKKPHSHSHCEVFIHVKGKMEIFVEKNFYRISDESIRLYASGELHFGNLGAGKNEWYQISLPKEFFSDNAYAPLGAVFFDRNFGEKNVFFSSQYREIIGLMKEIFNFYNKKDVFFEPLGVGNLLRVLCIINKSALEPNNAVPANDFVLADILNVINRHYAEISSVADLCSMTNYSASYLNKLFKRSMNITPYKFLISKKLNEAKNALSAGCSVTNACDAAGFNNYSNFITLFHKSFGVTPNKFAARFCERKTP